MLEQVDGADRVDVAQDEVLEVYRSINENLMSADGHPSQPSLASVVGVKESGSGRVRIFVHYFLLEDRVGILYEEEDEVSPKSYAGKRDEAIESVESMGFILDNMQFRSLDEDERQRAFETLAAFGARPGETETGTGAEASDEAGDEELEEAEIDEEGDDAPPADDPETILILEDDEEQEEKPAAEAGDGLGDPELWRVFFRMIASF